MGHSAVWSIERYEMGIIDYLKRQQKTGRKWGRDNIELLRPVVNIFVGNFSNEEYEALKETLEERIGMTSKVFFSRVCSENVYAEDEVFYPFVVDSLAGIRPYDASKWEMLNRCLDDKAEFKQDVLDFVNKVFNTVSSVAYTSQGRIRLNYIIKSDSVDAAILPSFVKACNECFNSYFANGVYTDVYCVVDQKGYNCEEYGEERKALNYLNLSIVDSLVNEKVFKLAYIVSNYTSQNCLEQDCMTEMMQTIALNVIVKDGISVGNDVNAYSHDNFTEEVRASEGNFCSLGTLNLKVEEAVRSYVVYKTVFGDFCQSETSDNIVAGLIRSMGIDKNDLETKISGLFVNRGFSERVFYPMVANKQIGAASFLTMERRELIEEIFGRNLEYFWDLNYRTDVEKREQLVESITDRVRLVLREAYKTNGCSLAEISKAISEVEVSFEKYVVEYEKAFNDMKIAFDEWICSKADIKNVKEKVKETDTLRAVYQLAAQYMEKRVSIVNHENNLYVSKKCLQGIRESSQYYKKQAQVVREAYKELITLIDDIEQTELPLLVGNMNNYYTDVTQDYLEASGEYQEFRRNTNNKICSRDLAGDEIFAAIQSFCEEKILPAECYADDISMELVQRLKNYDGLTTEDDIYNRAFSTIMDNKKYYSNHTEVGSIYQEVCFLVNLDNKFVKCANENMKKLLINRELKLFYERNYKGMDILFMEGCFELRALYQYNLYQKASENLMKK